VASLQKTAVLLCEGLTGGAGMSYFTTIMVTASFKLTEGQMRQLRRNAHAKRLSLSDYLRAAALPEEKPQSPDVVPKRHPVSGLWYNAAPNQANPSLEEIQEALADFP